MTKEEIKNLLDNKEQEIKELIQLNGNTGKIKPKKVLPINQYNKIKDNIKRLCKRLRETEYPAQRETLLTVLKEEQNKLKLYKPAKKKYKRPVSRDAMGHIAKGCLNTTK